MRPAKILYKIGVIAVFFGKTETRKRDRYTAHKKILLQQPPNYEYTLADVKSGGWQIVKYWLETVHPNEPVRFLRVEIEVLGLPGDWRTIHRWDSDVKRGDCEPEPIPERMPE